MIRKLLLSCGAISSALYLVAIDLIVPLRHAGYHDFTSQMGLAERVNIYATMLWMVSLAASLW